MHTNATAAPAWTNAERDHLQREARALGAFGAIFQPKAIGKFLPATATLRDCRDLVARSFIADCAPVVHWLLPDLLEGFDAEADSRYSLAELIQPRATIAVGAALWCVDDVGAESWLKVGREYTVQAVRAGGWLYVSGDSGGGGDAGWHHACHFIPA